MGMATVLTVWRANISLDGIEIALNLSTTDFDLCQGCSNLLPPHATPTLLLKKPSEVTGEPLCEKAWKSILSGGGNWREFIALSRDDVTVSNDIRKHEDSTARHTARAVRINSCSSRGIQRLTISPTSLINRDTLLPCFWLQKTTPSSVPYRRSTRGYYISTVYSDMLLHAILNNNRRHRVRTTNVSGPLDNQREGTENASMETTTAPPRKTKRYNNKLRV